MYISNWFVAESRRLSNTFLTDMLKKEQFINDFVVNPQSLTDFGRVKRQTTEFRSDYLALELRGGRPVFTFNLGSGAASIQSNRLVNDGHWHQIYAKR